MTDAEINKAARFLPQIDDDQRPCVALGDEPVLVFAYMSNGTLRVTIDTETHSGEPLPFQVDVNSATVARGVII